MNANGLDEARMRDYLLGKLPESAMQALEAESLENPEVQRRLEIVEDELISDYVADENLDMDDRCRMERVFLSPVSRREKLLFTQALRQRALQDLAAAESRTVLRRCADAARSLLVSPLPAWAVRTAIAFSLIVNAGLVKLTVDQTRKVAALEAETDLWRERSAQMTARLADVVARASRQQRRLRAESLESARLREGVSQLRSLLAGLRVPFTLGTRLLRSSGEIPRLKLSAGAAVIELRIQLSLEAEGYLRYRALIDAVDRADSVDFTGLRARPEAGRLELDLPLAADRFPSGDYRLRLFGLDAQGVQEELNQYVFRIEREATGEKTDR